MFQCKFPSEPRTRSCGYVGRLSCSVADLPQGSGWAPGKSICGCKEQKPLLLILVSRGVTERLQGNLTAPTAGRQFRELEPGTASKVELFSPTQGPPSSHDSWSVCLSLTVSAGLLAHLLPPPFSLLPVPTLLVLPRLWHPLSPSCLLEGIRLVPGWSVGCLASDQVSTPDPISPVWERQGVGQAVTSS